MVALAALAVGVMLLAVLGEADRDPQATDTLPAGYPSTAAVQLQESLPSQDTSVGVVLFTAESIADVVPALEEVVGGLDTGAPGPPASVPVAEDDTAAIAVVGVPSTTATEVADAVETLRADLREAVPEGVQVQVTGPAAIRADLASVFQGAALRLLAITASVVTVLLLVTYRSPTLWSCRWPWWRWPTGPRSRWPPRCWPPWASRGMSRPSASCRSWCSVRAPTTACC